MSRGSAILMIVLTKFDKKILVDNPDVVELFNEDFLYYSLATPVWRAASATALATVFPTRGSNASGMI